MKIEIKDRFNGSVLFSCEADSLKIAVEMAIDAKANLHGADLSGADLRYADLDSADLSGASLRGADLRYADLDSADLSGANLSSANLSGANLSSANLSGANLSSANLSSADLRGANLHDTSLRYANLHGADIDYSCWPLWCGSKGVKIDVNIAMQLAAHFCAVECEDNEYQKARKAILKFALKSHRAGDLDIGETND